MFQTKPQIAIDLIDRAKANGIEVMAWTADEAYGRDGAFLDGLDSRGEAFVVEVPPNARAWLKKPKVLKAPPENERGRPKTYPRLDASEPSPSEVRNLTLHSPRFRRQTPQKYKSLSENPVAPVQQPADARLPRRRQRVFGYVVSCKIKDTHHGAEVWEIRWEKCWRKTHTDQLVSNQGTLVVARNVLTDEVKYFLSNRVPGRDGWSLRKLLRVAFGRWPIEDCFRETKEELGLDHFECRGWRCIHRHLFVTLLTQLFCARARQKLSPSEDVESGELLTTEQVRRAADVLVRGILLPPKARERLHRTEADRQTYHARRHTQAAKSDRKTRRKRLLQLGIDPDNIKSVPPKNTR